jgi:hypothetical protein
MLKLWILGLLIITIIILLVTAMSYVDSNSEQLTANARHIMFLINLLLIFFIIYVLWKHTYINLVIATIIIVGVSIINYILMNRIENHSLRNLNLLLIVLFIGVYFYSVTQSVKII